MPWTLQRTYSLLDTIDRHPVDWWLVYQNSESPRPWMRVLKRGFEHVIALRRDGRVWVLVSPGFSFVDVQLIRDDMTPWQMFPQATVQHVVAMRTERLAFEFHIGPLTCVDVAKSLLGIRSWWVRTPWQLFKYCRS